MDPTHSQPSRLTTPSLLHPRIWQPGSVVCALLPYSPFLSWLCFEGLLGVLRLHACHHIFSQHCCLMVTLTPHLNRWGNWGSERLCGLPGWSGGCSAEWLFWALSVWPQSMLAPLSTAPPCVSGCVKAKAGFDPHVHSLSWPPTPTQMNRQLLALWHWSCIFTYSYFCISNVFISIIQLFSQNRQNLVLMISCFLLGYLGEHQPRSCLGKKQ